MNVAAILIPYILLHAANTLSLKWLAHAGFPTYHTLFYRGLACVVAGAIAGAVYRRSLIPRQPLVQAARFWLAGFSLLLLTSAYAYAHATTVSVIQRMDTPLLVMLGPWAGVAATGRQRGLALLSSALVLGVGLFARGGGEAPVGYVLAFLGTVGLTFGYLLLRSSAASENLSVIAVTGGLAIVFYGAAGSLWARGPLFLGGAGVTVACLSGVMMYFIYDTTIRLYRLMDVALAEYPTLIASLLVLPAEALWLGTQFSAPYVLSMVANVVLLGGILLLGRKRSTA